MQEIEVKILEINPKEIQRKIGELGGKKSFDGEMTAWFFDTAEQALKARGDVLRLRKEGQETVLAYKKHLSRGEAKIMEETETQVSDADNMAKILEQAGFEVMKKTRKFRTQYDVEHAHIVIDDYQDDLGPIPVFLEVEAKNMERLEEVVHALGFRMEDCLNWSTRELVKHYLG